MSTKAPLVFKDPAVLRDLSAIHEKFVVVERISPLESIVGVYVELTGVVDEPSSFLKQSR